MSSEVSSDIQDQWKEIAGGIRAAIAKQVPLMPAMKMDEQKQFVELVDSAMWHEIKALNFDDADAHYQRKATIGVD